MTKEKIIIRETKDGRIETIPMSKFKLSEEAQKELNQMKKELKLDERAEKIKA